MGSPEVTYLRPGNMLVGRERELFLGDEIAATPLARVFRVKGVADRAVKVYTPFQDNPDGRNLYKRIQREANIHSRVHHLNIIPFGSYDEREIPGHFAPFLEMGLGWGTTLFDIIKDGELAAKFTSAQKHAVLTQIARAVDYLHNEGIIHRDIKPKNIFMGDNGVQLGDFSIALDKNGEVFDEDIFLGSPPFAAPEKYLGTVGDEKTDLWSYGVLAYWLWTDGKLPYILPSEPNEMDYRDACLLQVPLLLRDRIKGKMTPWQKAWEPIITTMLAKAPEERYDDFGKVINVLEAVRLRAEAEDLSQGLTDKTGRHRADRAGTVLDIEADTSRVVFQAR